MSKPDWEAIESAYRAGSLSVRSIGEKHGVNHATILKRANKEGWQRDLTEKVRAATKAKVTKSVTKDGNQSPVVTDEQIIDKASDEAAAVVMAHREGLAAWRYTKPVLVAEINTLANQLQIKIPGLPG